MGDSTDLGPAAPQRWAGAAGLPTALGQRARPAALDQDRVRSHRSSLLRSRFQVPVLPHPPQRLGITPYRPPMRHRVAHSSSVTGWTESRELLTRTMEASRFSALMASRVTGRGSGLTALMSPMPNRPLSSVGSG